MFYISLATGEMIHMVFFVIQISFMKLYFLILKKKDEAYYPIHTLVYCFMPK